MKTNEVLETIKARRSVRVYDKKQVPSEDLNAILEAATYAPSGMHYETWHFTAVRNAAKLEELNNRIKEAFAKSDDKRLQERGHSETYCCYYHAPSLVIVSNDPTQWPGWTVPVPLRICFWQPVLWASVLAGSINSGRLAMIRKSGRILPLLEYPRTIKFTVA